MKIDDFIECDINSVSVVSEPNGRKKVLFCILDHNKNKWELCADDVKYFLLNGMCLQNLIESINLYKTSNINECLEDVRSKVFYLLQGRYPEAQDEEFLREVVEKKIDDIKASTSLLLEIQPVYGAYILLMTSGISITQIL